MKENERGRNRTLKIRLFPEEEELLERKARIAGKNKSDYIRDFILYSEVRSRPIWQDEISDSYFMRLTESGITSIRLLTIPT